MANRQVEVQPQMAAPIVLASLTELARDLTLLNVQLLNIR